MVSELKWEWKMIEMDGIESNRITLNAEDLDGWYERLNGWMVWTVREIKQTAAMADLLDCFYDKGYALEWVLIWWSSCIFLISWIELI